MKTITTHDVRGLEHAKREEIIFPAIDRLAAEGGEMRIVFEFNPLPLEYMLSARKGFEVVREKEAEGEYVLLVKNPNAAGEADGGDAAAKRAQLKGILEKLRSGEDVEAAKRDAREFLKEVDATTLGIVEQELLQEGFTHAEIKGSLCDLHLEAIRDSLVAKRIEVEAPHPIHTLMEEHKIILESLANLARITARLKTLNGYEEMGEDLAELIAISKHLVEAENHHQREEEALFPRIAKHGITEPPDIMKQDHDEFRKHKRALYGLTQNHAKHGFAEFKAQAVEHGEFIARELESHIFKEDNILYQIALQVLEPHEWDEVKKDCDKLGYCCYKPSDAGDACGCAHGD